MSDHEFDSSHYRARVLRQVMARRHHAILESPRLRVAAERHQQLLATSESYRDAVDRGEARAGSAASPPPGDPDSNCVDIGGLRWWVPPDARTERGFAVKMLRKKWLPLTEILLARELAVGTAMLDIGANIGATSIPRVVLGDFQYVYAAEPEPANYDCLVRNVAANGLAGFVLPDRVAIGDVNGEETLRVNAKMAQHMLSRGPHGPEDGHHYINVRSRTLDTWVRELGIDLHDVTFVKCDTQGWEGHILRGAPEVLRHKHIAWQLEFWPKGLRKAGVDRQELFELIRANFTHFFELSEGLQAAPHARRTADLETALAEVGTARSGSDLLVYNAD